MLLVDADFPEDVNLYAQPRNIIKFSSSILVARCSAIPAQPRKRFQKQGCGPANSQVILSNQVALQFQKVLKEASERMRHVRKGTANPNMKLVLVAPRNGEIYPSDPETPKPFSSPFRARNPERSSDSNSPQNLGSRRIYSQR